MKSQLVADVVLLLLLFGGASCRGPEQAGSELWRNVQRLARDESKESVKKALGEPARIAPQASVLGGFPYSAGLSHHCWVYPSGLEWGMPFAKDISMFSAERPKKEPEGKYAVIASFDNTGKIKDILIRLGKP